MVETQYNEEDEQFDEALEASEYGREGMAGMPGYGEMRDPYAAEVNSMADGFEDRVEDVMAGEGGPTPADEENLDPWMADTSGSADYGFEQEAEPPEPANEEPQGSIYDRVDAGDFKPLS